MTYEENFDIMQILTEKDKPFLVRPRMLEYMKTVTVEEPPTVEEILKEPEELGNNGEPIIELQDEPEPDPWTKTQEQYLSGKPKEDYPEYTGEPTF